MSVRTFFDKVFVVVSNDARVRRDDDLTSSRRYEQGDEIPPGKAVGDPVTIPQFAEVRALEARADGSNLFLRVRPAADAAAAPFGWTAATNFAGGLENEIVGLLPDTWDVEPGEENYTVTDARAIVRGGAPGFAPTAATIARGTQCCVTETSADGRHVRVCRATRSPAGAIDRGDDLGWTARPNLTQGWSPVFTSPAWADTKGPCAAWEGGSFIGQRVLVHIVGTGGAIKQITLDSLPHYMALRNAALADNVDLAVTSGFRTFAKQAELRRRFERGGNRAAKAGFSNHQHGQAFDLNTMGFEGTRNYDWLKRNGPRHGFIRTVSGEHWHWEYRPNDQHVRQGLHKKPGVSP